MERKNEFEGKLKRNGYIKKEKWVRLKNTQ